MSIVPFVDQTYTMPESLFSKEQRAGCTLFVQDAKINFKKLAQDPSDSVYSCEFGLGAMAQWGMPVWGEASSRPLERAVSVLNEMKLPVWLLEPSKMIQSHEEVGKGGAFLPKFSEALKKYPANRFCSDSLSNDTAKAPGFDLSELSSYDAIGVTSYESQSYPNVLLMDGGPFGPVNRVFAYKHLSRLITNGTEGKAQNPNFVIIESTYAPEVAQFLKQHFPEDSRLVLKHPATSRGEGVVILNASNEEALDIQLKELLAEDSAFKKVSSLSICLIEQFISTAESRPAISIADANADATETITRVVYMALQNKGETELYTLDAVKCYEDPSTHTSAYTKGMVKLGKFNDGVFEVLTAKECGMVHKSVCREISAIATRAMNYDSQAAVEYFLKSDNHILNLIGIELFEPSLVCNYREKKGEGYCVTPRQYELFLDLIKRNKSPIVLERIFKNIILDEGLKIFEKPENDTITPKCIELLEEILKAVASSEIKEKIVGGVAAITAFTFCKPVPHDGLKLTFIKRFLIGISGDYYPILKCNTSCLESYLDAVSHPEEWYLPVATFCAEQEAKLLALSPKKIPREMYEQLIKTLIPKFGHLSGYIFKGIARYEAMVGEGWFDKMWKKYHTRICCSGEAKEILHSLLALPDFHRMELEAEQAFELISTFKKYVDSYNAQCEFYGLVRLLSHFSGIRAPVAYQFISDVLDYEVNAKAYHVLADVILKKSLKLPNINDFLERASKTKKDASFKSIQDFVHACSLA